MELMDVLPVKENLTFVLVKELSLKKVIFGILGNMALPN
jgi:hypothetical protein